MKKHIIMPCMVVLLMIFYLPIRFILPINVGMDFWLIFYGVLQVAFFIMGIKFLGELPYNSLTKWVVAYIGYGIVISLMTFVNYGISEMIIAIRLYTLPAAGYFFGLQITKLEDIRKVSLYLFVILSIVSLGYTLDFYWFIFKGGQALSELWVPDIDSYEWTLSSQGGIGGWVGGLFGYPHPNGLAAACGGILGISIMQQKMKTSIYNIFLLLICLIPLLLGASRLSLLIFIPFACYLFILNLGVKAIKIVFMLTIGIALVSGILYYSQFSFQFINFLENINILSSDVVQEHYGSWMGATFTEFHGELDKYWHLWILGTGFVDTLSSQPPPYVWVNNDIWILSLASNIGFIGVLLLLMPPLKITAFFLFNFFKINVKSDYLVPFALVSMMIIYVSFHSSNLRFFGISYLYFLCLGISAQLFSAEEIEKSTPIELSAATPAPAIVSSFNQSNNT